MKKADEAPEKIYVADTTFPDYVDFDGSPINTKRIDNRDIEYTRTDAFIEKALDYIENNIYNHYDGDNEYGICGGYVKKEEFVEKFINYMKRE